MNKARLKPLKIVAAIAFAATSFTVNAQKLPAIQNTGLYAPADIKVDGKPTEWGSFQAYNKTTHIFYSLANDNNALYFVVQATDAHDVQKILTGGITLTVKSAGNKTTMSLAVGFPRMYTKDTGPIVTKLKDEQTNMDTDLPDMNKQLISAANQIQVAGIKQITDTLISVYNEQGIKATGLLDSKRAYTYELAIPLKYLQQVIGSDATFTYNIKLNGRLNALKLPAGAAGAPRVMNITSVRLNGAAADPAVMAAMQDLNEPTDFSGTYTLAKK